MDVQDAHCAVEEQRRLFEESFKRRRMQDLTLPASETETPPQPLPLSVSSNTFQICSEALVRLLNDLEADPETRNNSRQLLEHVILEREKANKEVSSIIVQTVEYSSLKGTCPKPGIRFTMGSGIHLDDAELASQEPRIALLSKSICRYRKCLSAF